MSSLISRPAANMLANLVKSSKLNCSSSRNNVRIRFRPNRLPQVDVPVKEKSMEEFLETSVPALKIQEKVNETYVEAIPLDTGRDGKVINIQSSHACSLCRLNLTNLNYTDVMILSQFLRRDGSILTINESQLCSKQYHLVRKLINQAQRCNLIQRPANYLVPGPWHDLNTYLERDRRRDQPMKVIKKQYWKI